MITYKSPDLTQHPPRSPRVRLGGFVHLPRLLDKARAFAAGKTGEYKYNSRLDHVFFTFAGLNAEDFLAAVKSGLSDTQMLAWVQEHARPARPAWEIEGWSHWLENMTPGDAHRLTMVAELITQRAPGREDIRTLFERLDLDDYLTFHGQP